MLGEERVLSAELTANQIYVSSPNSFFWAFVADMMPEPIDKTACKNIGNELTSNHMAILRW